MKYLPLFLCVIFYACNTNVDNNVGVNPENSSDNYLDGYCDPAKLSKDTLYFRKHGGFDCVVVTGAIWPPLRGHYGYGSYNEECESILANYSFLENGRIVSVQNDYCKNNYCYETVAIYSNPSSAPVTKIECSWYSVAHTSKESLFVSVDKNETGKERSIYVPLQTAYTCGDTGFTIIQLAE